MPRKAESCFIRHKIQQKVCSRFTILLRSQLEYIRRFGSRRCCTDNHMVSMLKKHTLHHFGVMTFVLIFMNLRKFFAEYRLRPLDYEQNTNASSVLHLQPTCCNPFSNQILYITLCWDAGIRNFSPNYSNSFLQIIRYFWRTQQWHKTKPTTIENIINR